MNFVNVRLRVHLRKILRIFWLDQITNNELWKRTKQPRIDLQIRKRKWGWLGHTLPKPIDDITRQGLEWNPQGKRGRGRPKNAWRRTVLEEAKGVKKTWAEIKCDAKNRLRWRILMFRSGMMGLLIDWRLLVQDAVRKLPITPTVLFLSREKAVQSRLSKEVAWKEIQKYPKYA